MPLISLAPVFETQLRLSLFCEILVSLLQPPCIGTGRVGLFCWHVMPTTQLCFFSPVLLKHFTSLQTIEPLLSLCLLSMKFP